MSRKRCAVYHDLSVKHILNTSKQEMTNQNNWIARTEDKQRRKWNSQKRITILVYSLRKESCFFDGLRNWCMKLFNKIQPSLPSMISRRDSFSEASALSCAFVKFPCSYPPVYTEYKHALLLFIISLTMIYFVNQLSFLKWLRPL